MNKLAIIGIYMQVESCLNARSRGQHVYICPIKLIHRSKGKMNYIYNKQFYKLSRKYSKDIRYLNTTFVLTHRLDFLIEKLHL